MSGQIFPEEMSGRGGPGILEREVQEFLATNLQLLDVPDLALVGVEYSVSVGRVDILASAPYDSLYVIEIKRSAATREDVGQIQSYMGAVAEKFPSAAVHGLLVAQDLTAGARHALSFASRVRFIPFKISFTFGRPTTTKPTRPLVPAEVTPPWADDERIRCRTCAEEVSVIRMNSMTAICSRCKNII